VKAEELAQLWAPLFQAWSMEHVVPESSDTEVQALVALWLSRAPYPTPGKRAPMPVTTPMLARLAEVHVRGRHEAGVFRLEVHLVPIAAAMLKVAPIP